MFGPQWADPEYQEECVMKGFKTKFIISDLQSSQYEPQLKRRPTTLREDIYKISLCFIKCQFYVWHYELYKWFVINFKNSEDRSTRDTFLPYNVYINSSHFLHCSPDILDSLTSFKSQPIIFLLSSTISTLLNIEKWPPPPTSTTPNVSYFVLFFFFS